ncbi:type II CRISPR-associated endonuclease Cas1 [Olsenella porci]|uniref:Type II CRISPR-associated endonuclease Cas1 n=1 Tax=Olsenella porci TaxID=2652279 RepID=A0A6N7XAN6_9ACTN|nr:type II CRISPR-associated endonuclease Cas1 [Olsenella porci]MST72457.1 type II CRISPR-associated endonuclease Cas1 [Olsenella porci]
MPWRAFCPSHHACHDGEKPSPLHPNHPDGCQRTTVPPHGSAGRHARSVQGPTLWKRVVVSKIENQARALSILGLDGAEEVWSFSLGVCPGDPDNREGVAARCYFQHLQPDLNRRCRDPLNSALNYGAAIVQAAVARSLVVAGFVPALGIHHHSQLNAFNLADDIMEPLRPVVDILALEVVESSCELSRQQRSKLRGVLLRTVCLENQKMTVLRATNRMGESLRGATTCEDASLMLTPTILAQGTETQCA